MPYPAVRLVWIRPAGMQELGIRPLYKAPSAIAVDVSMQNGTLKSSQAAEQSDRDEHGVLDTCTYALLIHLPRKTETTDIDSADISMCRSPRTFASPDHDQAYTVVLMFASRNRSRNSTSARRTRGDRRKIQVARVVPGRLHSRVRCNLNLLTTQDVAKLLVAVTGFT